MQIYYGFTISEFLGLVVGGITLVVLLVYYGVSAIIRALKSRRTQRAADGANVCPKCHHTVAAGICVTCGIPTTPRR